MAISTQPVCAHGRTPLIGFAALSLALSACGGGGGDGSRVPGPGGSGTLLAEVRYGLLADVYGLMPSASGGTTVELYAGDVMVGPDIDDERPAGSNLADDQITYDFLGANPDTLQPRLLITRQIGAAEFAAAFDALDDKLRRVQPGWCGQNTSIQPFSLVARNAALQLTFTRDLGVTDDFFVQRGPGGNVVGLKNTEAVQLLEITGDPTAASPIGVFRQIATRYVVRGKQLIVDPVLLGSEGLQLQVRNSAAGMPESPDQVGANIRLAIALEGPLALPGIEPDNQGSLVGNNNAGARSVVRDFRSGNHKDNTPEVSQGFLRDPLAPAIAGELLLYLENVDDGPDPSSKVITLYKGGLAHEIDRGDVVRVFFDNSGVPVAVTEVIVDPGDDFGQPSVQHVRAVVRRVEDQNGADVLEQHDPSRRTGYPGNTSAREPWLVQNAPVAVLLADYHAGRDDPVNFVTFSPAPLPGPGGAPSAASTNISPFAGAVIRFTKPVDMASVKPLDTFFFAMRDLLDPQAMEDFRLGRDGRFGPVIEPSTFTAAKYATPFLVASQLFDQDGSQTTLRLQPKLGFYLDAAMRADPGRFVYYLHVLGGGSGIRDLAGNLLDVGTSAAAEQSIVIPFTLDERVKPTGEPLFPDNRVVSLARRLDASDEDEQPSYLVPAEVQAEAGPINPVAVALEDLFGGVISLGDGTLSARPGSRVTFAVDDVSQPPAPAQSSAQRSCPTGVLYSNFSESVLASRSTQTRFGQALQNPLNPFGCRLQTVWREIEMGLSTTDPNDFNLDVEQMYWAPFVGEPVYFDEFDRTSLFLGHAEQRPEPCVGNFSALPNLPFSGLVPRFDDNYLFNRDLTGARESAPGRVTAYADVPLTVLASQSVRPPTSSYRYLPLPAFQKPYFVWRDERVLEQGGDSREGWDTDTQRRQLYRGPVVSFSAAFTPYLLSPFAGGRGRLAVPGTGGVVLTNGTWDNQTNYSFAPATQRESLTGGLVGSIALPLLADFWTYPDDPTLPAGNPFRASGANGWQVSLAVASWPRPDFRVYAAGGLVGGQPQLLDPSVPAQALGGFTPQGQRTPPGDNTLFWLMTDFVKRVSVVTGGFVDLWDPHRAHAWPPDDPRLGPYFDPDPAGSGPRMPAGIAPTYDYLIDPPARLLPGGTAALAEFRGAGAVDLAPWAAAVHGYLPPDWRNVPLDPRKAGDAHIRKFDDRPPVARNAWTHYYHRHITTYTSDPAQLADDSFTSQFAGPSESFRPSDVRYFNWRLVLTNNVDASPPVSPVLESFSVVYRFEPQP